MTSPLIALTTDFGAGSHYVAQMKGVIYSALPAARIVDVTHAIRPQSIRHAEVVFRSTAFCMPLGTVHVVVVDPGVGTDRRPIAVTAAGMTFVGPDNGVLGLALKQDGARAVVLDRRSFFREPVSPTFHGRDIFTPVAAELAAGLALDDVGTPIDDAIPSTLPAVAKHANGVTGEVLAADDFGNLLTNIPGRYIGAIGDSWTVRVDGRVAERVRTYGEGPAQTPLALVGSDGYLEIAVRDGSAVALFGTDDGLEIECGPGNSA
ncbi:MAG: SAM-dependent chlorinase/fluorinase [Myxococcota bacterium]